MYKKPIGTIIFYAQLNGTKPVITGECEVYEEDIGDRGIKDFLSNTAVDWAYEAVHTDNLNYWAEFKDA